MSGSLCRRSLTGAARCNSRIASRTLPTLVGRSTAVQQRGLRTCSGRVAVNYAVRPVNVGSAMSRVGQVRFMAEKIIKVPPLAESIQEGTLSQLHKKVGDYIARDEPIATIETDKVDVSINSPESGTILEFFPAEGDTVAVGGNLARVELGDAPKGGAAPEPTKQEEAPKPETKQEEPTKAAEPAKPEPAAAPKPAPTPAKPAEAPKPAPAPSKAPSPAQPVQFDAENFPGYMPGSRTERRVPMSRMRQKIASHLKESQNVAASLTTFNEIDMSNLLSLRKTYKDAVLDKHGVKLGFMGAFIKAATAALHEVPAVNASIEGNEIVYHDYMDVSVAVATPKGLVTPVIRNCESLSIVQLEQAMAALGKKARDNKITIEDLAGGTFTISNGGVFGSLMGTPIINQPQSAILGMHATKDRPVVVNGKIEIRPMMYVALTYDHRIIDGREAVTFLVKVKEAIEDPQRLLLNV